jgi:hypothetical protein
MAKRILVVFTFRSIDMLLAEGGSQAWALNQANARRCSYIVCTRNRHHEDASQQEEHGAAFLVGKISGVEPAPDEPERFIVKFDRYALIDPQPIIWPGARNPVWYVDDFAEIQIDESSLEWLPMPEAGYTERAFEIARQDVAAPSPTSDRMTIADAKAGLAASFGVSPDRIEITIRG